MLRSYSVVELVPHRPPMVLIDRVVGYDLEAKSLTAEVTIKERWKDGYVAIEYMAQTAAALVGLFDRLEHEQSLSRPGFLLGTRKLSLMENGFTVGGVYRITAVSLFCDGDAAAFGCEMTDSGGHIVATAALNAYRPSNVAEFFDDCR